MARLKDLQEILRLSRREAMYVRKVFVENGLIIVNKDKTISVNLEYAFKGKMEKKKELKGNVIRMFEEAIRELYEKSDPREHKRLALLVELLPHINFTHNKTSFKKYHLLYYTTKRTIKQVIFCGYY